MSGSFTAFAQEDRNYDEIVIAASIQSVGIFEIPTVIKNDTVYLSIARLFDVLKIKYEISKNIDTIRGFYIYQDSTYVIDVNRNTIHKHKQSYNIAHSALIRTETDLYVKTDFLSTHFGLQCSYNMRMLSVNIFSREELPIVRELRLEECRKNSMKVKNEYHADTMIRKVYPFFRLGTIDWGFVSNNGIKRNADTRVNFGLGGNFAGGEISSMFNFVYNQKINWKQQFYQWRLVNNNSSILKQITIGKIIVPSVRSVFAPFIGVQISNVSTLSRQSFSSYRITNYTQPGWMVELYVNGILLNYQKADANGFFSFDVPLSYGNSIIRLKHYGPYGEEKSFEQSINIPYTLHPPKVFGYTLSTGLIEDDSNSHFTKADFSYGISARLSVNGGIEYFQSTNAVNYMPYLSSSLRVSRSLLLYGEYNYRVRDRFLLYYKTKKNLQLEMSYTKFNLNQLVVNTQVLKENKVIISTPVRFSKLSLYSQMTYNKSYLANANFTNIEWLLSGYFYGTDISISSYGIFFNKLQPNIYSNVSFSFAIPFKLQLRSQFQFKYITNSFVSFRESIEKSRGNMFASIYYEQNFVSNFKSIGIQFRYNLPFAHIGIGSTISNNSVSFIEAARGSIIYDSKNRFIKPDNVYNINRSGILLEPYLDTNCNGRKDASESRVSGLKFKINGGNVLPSGKDSIVRIINLDPSNKYYINISKTGFDNISWQLGKHTYSIETTANTYSYLQIPVYVLGEVNGFVYMTKNGVSKGQGQVYVCIYRDTSLVAKVMTEPDGYYSYLGLIPGKYRVCIDESQMARIDMNASLPHNIQIKSSTDGDIVDGIDFNLSPHSKTNNSIRTETYFDDQQYERH